MRLPLLLPLLFSILTPSLASPATVPLAARADPPAPTVKLAYATYRGKRDSANNLNVFLGVRFAAPPVGNLRFAPAVPPATYGGIQDATRQPLQCIQVSGDSDIDSKQSEDCLYANVYSPATVPTGGLPVMVWVLGGALQAGSSAYYDPTRMIASASTKPFIAVIIQYRLGALGFLASPEIAAGGGLNAGMTDVRQALRWVQTYIGAFGGDKTKVTLWGQSAGGALALGVAGAQFGKENLFRSVIGSSPWLPATVSCSSSYFANQYATFLQYAHCTHGGLACLRALSAHNIGLLNTGMAGYIQKGYPLAYFPCVETASSGYLRRSTTSSLLAGQVSGAYAIGGSNARDGASFFPPEAAKPSSPTQADQWTVAFLQKGFPLSDAQIAQVMSAYPLNLFADNTDRGSTLIQDAFFACPATWLASAYPSKGYKQLFGVGAATHAEELGYEYPQYATWVPESAAFSKAWLAEFTSFITSTPPVPTSSSPAWPAFIKGGAEQYKNFNETLVNGKWTPSISIQTAKDATRVRAGSTSRCALWAKLRSDGGW